MCIYNEYMNLEVIWERERLSWYLQLILIIIETFYIVDSAREPL